ncbi:unnamed protein product [Polarella glacialis]|uniref:Uncharacterized protein n=1 Tax=Polarella glacialis TaxID=89957 RepID=A0A813JIQ9_POLGL|nr:unnamed protein product [Polarella glacialis]|mmetsp:Transcript_49414/g.88876  ORF Transcript_49414/g.88876 Transcript_49414/m.88876 type:complete len:129 (+) Transcript_49414:70-456(+)
MALWTALRASCFAALLLASTLPVPLATATTRSSLGSNGAGFSSNSNNNNINNNINNNANNSSQLDEDSLNAMLSLLDDDEEIKALSEEAWHRFKRPRIRLLTVASKRAAAGDPDPLAPEKASPTSPMI